MTSTFSWNMSIGGRRQRQHRSWPSTSFSPVREPHVFNTRDGDIQEENEEELIWAAIERLPTFDRIRKGLLNQMLDNGKIVHCPIDFTNLGLEDRRLLLESMLKCIEEDNERFLRGLRDRVNRVGIEVPKIEVRYENVSVEGDVHVGRRSLPTLLNATLNAFENILGLFPLAPSKKKNIRILKDVSGIIKPSRMTLLLGPPGSGKTTLLKTLAESLDRNLKVRGRITYCGHELNEFVARRTCAYIGEHDLHYGEMTVRETLDFSGRCLGVGTRYQMLEELLRREIGAGIKPDPEIDAFMKATSLSGQKASLQTDYVLKLLGLDICADTKVGDDMTRGISGGQRKRVTTGEMLAGPAKTLFMDEISTGLDSSTTFQITKFMRQMVHILDVTMVISLLQPAPETFELFDDIILLSEGQIVYQGPRENVLEFFETIGFKCPSRKGVADFLQEVTSKKDQQQYWFKKDQPYRYVSVSEFFDCFNSFHIGEKLVEELKVPYDKRKTHPAALVKEKFGISNWEILKACFSREWLLMKRAYVVFVFRMIQLAITAIFAATLFLRTDMPFGSVQDGNKYFGALFFTMLNMMFNCSGEQAMLVDKLTVFYKQRDFMFFPAWAFGLPMWFLRIPFSFIEPTIWVLLTYYTIGFAPSPSRFFRHYLVCVSIHNMSLGLFRLVGSVGRTQVLSNILAGLTYQLVLVLGGFIVAKNDIKPWMLWGYYVSPMSYGQNAIVINEFLDERWSKPNTDPRFNATTIGELLLKARGFYTQDYWFWICIGALFGFSLLFNFLFILAITYLNRDSNAFIEDEGDEKNENSSEISSLFEERRTGMILPFQPLSLAFNHLNYYVDMPAEMKSQGINEDRLQLLHDFSGAFRPGILTALMGVSGAGKTTLMDVLAGRKIGGYIEGSINISGYPKNQTTFARVSGYCEQNDIHSPYVTVYESLLFSAWLRLPSDIKTQTRKMFVEEVMELIELTPIKDALVGFPRVNGLSTEQRKRLTIAVELVSNPSIIFMDEPTSGLDARAAAIVMRTAIEGVPKIKVGYNPAAWMLQISSPSTEAQLGVDFAEIYANSALYRRNQELIEEISTPTSCSADLFFPTKYSQPFYVQFKACFWKQYWSYWRNPPYNCARFIFTISIGLLFGLIFWNKGQNLQKQQDLSNLVGAMYAVVLILGTINVMGVQPVVDMERIVLYRERAVRMYSELAYAFGQVAIEIIYNLIQTAIYTTVIYSMMGFAWNAAKFFILYYFFSMCLIFLTLFGMMSVALTPSYQFANIFGPALMAIWNLFSGFVIPRMQIPKWWRWYYWVSPNAWAVYGIITSQLGDKNEQIEVPGVGYMRVKEFLKQTYGFEYEFLPVVAIAHVGWVLLFLFVFAYAMKFLNFQKR
ncbi:pleiotropic drug resistance protein [Trifolium repens]|nr:pleiotropic drug resistance protein [Trifolium repens]